MRRLVLICALVLAVVPAWAGAAEEKSSVTSSGKPHFQATETVTAEATVLSVNKSKRTVKIRNADGDTVVVECGEAVKNFAQIHPKDVVTITYTEKLTVTAEGPGTPATTLESSTTSGKPGGQPKGSMTAKLQYKASITAIDKEKGTVTLTGPDNHVDTITPHNRANLDKVKVGDLVVFTYTEALAVSVAKPAAK